MEGKWFCVLKYSNIRYYNMEQEISLDAHNKQEFPPAHTARFDTSLIKRAFCVVLLLLYMGTLCAQDRMTPAKFEQGREEKLYSIFDIAEADGFTYLVDPAFSPDYCLTYDRESKSLILKQLKPRAQYCRRLRFSQRHIRADVWKLSISDSLADSLKRMFAAVVLTSSWLSEQRGLDGVNYYFLINSLFWWLRNDISLFKGIFNNSFFIFSDCSKIIII